jgi:hypothetical protein
MNVPELIPFFRYASFLHTAAVHDKMDAADLIPEGSFESSD